MNIYETKKNSLFIDKNFVFPQDKLSLAILHARSHHSTGEERGGRPFAHRNFLSEDFFATPVKKTLQEATYWYVYNNITY